MKMFFCQYNESFVALAKEKTSCVNERDMRKLIELLRFKYFASVNGCGKATKVIFNYH